MPQLDSVCRRVTAVILQSLPPFLRNTICDIRDPPIGEDPRDSRTVVRLGTLEDSTRVLARIIIRLSRCDSNLSKGVLIKVRQIKTSIEHRKITTTVLENSLREPGIRRLTSELRAVRAAIITHFCQSYLRLFVLPSLPTRRN
ncbi:hypothetical protein PGT21_036027 [Puccinia graminis f. sp. tritici]|uniref:Uncharacterized protein n=1 Tax=Puccinia graminis f. sp. tritici TaxID=56615 RepID=A0A5B0P4R9_PUCGR|nr:hypothetical protein PGT21_036027 [Puccinia graminis f. sp. tritici]